MKNIDYLTLHKPIRKVISNEIHTKNSSDKDKIFIMLSCDNHSICWMLQVDVITQDQNMGINVTTNHSPYDEFLNLLKFILPYGIKIKGLLHLDQAESEYFNYITATLLKEMFQMQDKSGYELVNEKLFFVSLKEKMENISTLNEIDLHFGKEILYNKTTNTIDMLNDIAGIQFTDIEEQIKEEFLLMTSQVTRIVTINKQNCLINELCSSDMGIYIPELNLLISDLTTNDWKEIETSTVHTKQKDFNIPLECSLLFNTNITSEKYFEETNNTFYSIFQEVSGEQIIKSIKITISGLYKKKIFTFENICKEFVKYFKKIEKDLMEINFTKCLTYSYFMLNSRTKNAHYSCNDLYRFPLPIPLGVIYSSNDMYDPSEQFLEKQKEFFKKILNLREEGETTLTITNNIVKKTSLENQLFYNEGNLITCENECPKKDMFTHNLEFYTYTSPHNKMTQVLNLNPISQKLLSGDYFYFFTQTEDRNFGASYRALQTLLSIYLLKGYANFEIPTIKEIQEILVYLGQVGSSFIMSTQPITMVSISMVLGYLIDIQSQIISVNKDNVSTFEKIISTNFDNNQILMSTSIYNVFSILGYEYTTVDKKMNLLLLNHIHSGKPGMLQFIKFGICKWMSIDEILEQNGTIELLITKLNN